LRYVTKYNGSQAARRSAEGRNDGW